MNKIKNGQADIIGLLVIVVLLIVLGGLYISFSSRPESTATQATLTSVQLNSFMESIRDYSVCPGQGLEKAAKPCLNGNTEFCGGKACDIIEREMGNIMLAAYPTEMRSKVISLEFVDILQDKVIATTGMASCNKLVCESSEISAGRSGRAAFRMCRCVS